MKKKITISLLFFAILLNAFPAMAEENDFNFVKKNFFEMLTIKDFLEENREKVTIPYESAEQMMNMTEEEQSDHAITNFKLYDEAIPSILEDCDIKQNDTVITFGYIEDVIIFPEKQEWQKYDAERNGNIRVILKGYLAGDDSPYNTLCLRTFDEDAFDFNTGEKVLVSGTFMKEGCVNDTDILYDCKIEKFEEAYDKNFVTEQEQYLYMITQDILHDNLGTTIYIPEISYNSNGIYMNYSDNMCEVVGKIDVLEDSRVTESKKYDIEFSYEKSSDSNDYSYQAEYVYIDGYNDFGNYIPIG